MFATLQIGIATGTAADSEESELLSSTTTRPCSSLPSVTMSNQHSHGLPPIPRRAGFQVRRPLSQTMLPSNLLDDAFERLWKDFKLQAEILQTCGNSPPPVAQHRALHSLWQHALTLNDSIESSWTQAAHRVTTRVREHITEVDELLAARKEDVENFVKSVDTVSFGIRERFSFPR